jgi:SAM-dependent methyltransferase
MYTCNLCGKDTVESLIDFGYHPIAHHFLEDPNQLEYKHNVNLGFCKKCGLSQLINPISPDKFYTDYNWLSSWKWNPHVPYLLHEISEHINLSLDSFVLEIGSNDGSFLKILKEKGYKNQLGLEPALDAVCAAEKLGVETINSYFTPNEAKKIVQNRGKSDLFICRQVIEHVANLSEFSEAMRIVLKPGSYVIIEVPDFGFNQVAPDYSAIWEEHVNHFTKNTLINFLNKIGIEVEKIKTELFSGQIIIAIGRYSGMPNINSCLSIEDEVKNADSYKNKWPKFKSKFHEYLNELKANGQKVAIYGAGCRANCLINYSEISQYIDLVVDDQKEKQDKFLPGSKLPIQNSEKLIEEAINVCLLAVNAENESKVIANNNDFSKKGGNFVSLHPPSSILPEFWNNL